MKFRRSSRLTIEVVLAVGSLTLAVVTLFWRDWIELIFRVDPDHHSGSFEWYVVAGLALVGMASAVLARREWLTLRPPSALPDAG